VVSYNMASSTYDEGQKNAYLLCNIGSIAQDRLDLLKNLDMRDKPVEY